MITATEKQPETRSMPVRRFSVSEFHRIIEDGIIQDRVELLEGSIVSIPVQTPRHDATVHVAEQALRDRLPAHWDVRIRSAATTSESEPEPDLVIAPGPAFRYKDRHPGPEDIALLVEVAESSLLRDREVKGRIYATARISLYWIVNIPDRVVEVYSDPTGPAAAPIFRQHQTFATDEALALVIGGQTFEPIPVREIFGD
jgi:hypothetical protein